MAEGPVGTDYSIVRWEGGGGGGGKEITLCEWLGD